MLKKLTPNLMVEDVRHTLTFYQDILGFDVVMTLPETAPFDFAIVRRDGVELMFQSRQSLSENVPALADSAIGASQTFYIEVTGISDLYQQTPGQGGDRGGLAHHLLWHPRGVLPRHQRLHPLVLRGQAASVSADPLIVDLP